MTRYVYLDMANEKLAAPLLKRKSTAFVLLIVVLSLPFAQSLPLLFNSGITEAKVTDNTEVRSRGFRSPGTTYHPNIAYVVDGREYVIVGFENTYSTGSKVQVLYRRNNPSQAKEFSFFGLMNSGLLGATIFLFIAWLGYFNYVLTKEHNSA